MSPIETWGAVCLSLNNTNNHLSVILSLCLSMQFTKGQDLLLPSVLLVIFYFSYSTSKKRVGLNWVKMFLLQTLSFTQVLPGSCLVDSSAFTRGKTLSLWYVDIIWSLFVSCCLQSTIPCNPWIHTIALGLHDYVTLTMIIIRLLSFLFFPFTLCLSNMHHFITFRYRKQWQCSQYP